MNANEVSYWFLLVPAFFSLLLARQVLKLRFWVLKDRDEETAYSRIEKEYCEPFVPTTMLVVPSQDERIRCGYRGLLFGAFAPFFFIYSFVPETHSGFSFCSFAIGVTALAGSVQQLWSYLYWQDTPGQVQSVEFKLDHLVVLTVEGNRQVYVYDGSMQVLVSCEQDLIGIWPLQVHHRTEVVLSIKDNSGISNFPFTGSGCGPLLALFRQSGAKVDVLADTPIQKKFALFTERVAPYWVAPPLPQRSKSRSKFKDMVCNGCGAKSSIDSNANSRVCEYCGSTDLTSV
jgi:ribosomal protein S27E